MSDITLRKGTHKYRTIKIYNMPYVSISLRKRYIANLTTDVKPLITRKQTENICSYDARFLNFFLKKGGNLLDIFCENPIFAAKDTLNSAFDVSLPKRADNRIPGQAGMKSANYDRMKRLPSRPNRQDLKSKTV